MPSGDKTPVHVPKGTAGAHRNAWHCTADFVEQVGKRKALIILQVRPLSLVFPTSVAMGSGTKWSLLARVKRMSHDA